MYSPRRFPSKTLVWLAAMLMPLQALPAANCWCASESWERVDAETASGHHVQKICCCCRTAPPGAASTYDEDKSCCQRVGPSPKPSCGGHSHTCTCSCQENNSSPAVPPAPTETRCRIVVDLLQLPTPICMSLEKSQPRSADEVPAFYTSAPERCTILCRFLL